MISKGKPQSKGWIISAEIKAFLRVWNAIRHSSSKTKWVSLAKSLVKGQANSEKVLMNLQ
jgi:hypothetical protein